MVSMTYKQSVEFCSAVSSTYSVVSWIGVVKPELDKMNLMLPFDYGAVHIACMSASLLSMRRFHEFFRGSKYRKDDYDCTDFGYKIQGFLTSDEKKSIDKRVAHFTFEMSESGDKVWEFKDLLVRLSRILMDFLSFILASCTEEMTRLEINSTIGYISACIDILNRGE